MKELKKVPVTAFLMLANAVVFLLVEFTGGSQNVEHMISWGASYTPLIVEQGEVFRLFTSMFLHFGMEHLVNNMLLLFVLGQRLEPVAGKISFLLIYLLGGIGGNLLSLWTEFSRQEYPVSAGASGAVFALMGAMIYVLIRSKGRVNGLSARQMLIMAAFSVYFGFASTGVNNAAHVGGLACGFLVCMLLYHPRKIRKTVP